MSGSGQADSAGIEDDGIVYIAVPALAVSFEPIVAWVETAIDEGLHLLGRRALVDLSRVPPAPPPSISFIRELSLILAPVMDRAKNCRCAVVVPVEWLERGRLFETLSSGSHVHFRTFVDSQLATGWLGSE